MKPKFSVIIPTLNEELFLPKLLESLAHQTKKNFDVIVVDGTSKDQTVTLARAMIQQLPGLNVVVSEKANLSLQKNLGAQKSNGEWLVFVDADSMLLPYFIERIDTYIQEFQPSIFTTWFRPDSEIGGDAIITLICNLALETGLVLHRPMAPGSLTIVRRLVFDTVGGYSETASWGEDYDFSKRAVERGYEIKIFREALSVWSLRRMRKKGKIATLSTYAMASILALLTKKTFKHMPGYVMGGDLYKEKKTKKQQ